MTTAKFVPHVRTDVSRRTFIALSQGRKWDLYLCFQGGKVDIVKLDKEKSAELTPRPNEGNWSVANAVRVYTESLMPKTERATLALHELATNADGPVQVSYPDQRPEGTDMDGPVVDTAPPASSKKTVEKSTPRKTTERDGQTITLAQLCEELKVEPRIARRRLRAAAGAAEGLRYVWDTKSQDLESVKAIIAGKTE